MQFVKILTEIDLQKHRRYMYIVRVWLCEWYSKVNYLKQNISIHHTGFEEDCLNLIKHTVHR